ncbi:hypothetical protein D3C73_1124000 [compost metagenome]
MYLLGDGLVLDQLQYVVAEYHRAFGHPQALADLEGTHVDLAGHAIVMHQILGQVRQAIEQALATGFKEAFYRRRVGRAVGRGHGFGHEVDYEVPTADIVGRQAAVVDPVVKLLAPRQVSLQITFVERVLAPGRIGKAAVIACRLQLRLAEQDILEFQAEMRDMLGAVDRLPDRLPEYHSSRSQ